MDIVTFKQKNVYIISDYNKLTKFTETIFKTLITKGVWNNFFIGYGPNLKG